MSKKATPILIAIVLGAIALTPVVINSFSDNPSFPKLGKSDKAVTINADSDNVAKVSYGFGYMMGKNLSQEAKDLQPNIIAQGLSDAFADKTPSLSEADIEKAVQEYQVKLQNEMQAKIAEIAKNNLEKGQAFLAENGKKPNIKTTASGLQYEVLKEGTGDTVKMNQQVSVFYEGKLLNGQVFDSTEKHGGQPFNFPVQEMTVISGWIEGIQLMNKGAKYRFYIPANLAYGEQGMANIEPNSVLIFDIELLDIQPIKS